jgi:hypothetical protein
MFAAFPLLVLPALIYNLIVLAVPGGFRGDANPRFSESIFSIPMASGAAWNVSIGDMLLCASLIVLFIELLKSTTSRRLAIVNHALSLLLFIGCLVELLLAPAFATSVFFLITLMVLLDVLAGFIVTIVAARRDIGFASPE